MLLGDKPENRCPDAKKFTPAKIVTIGFVNRKTTRRSTSVVSPSVNAKPRTPPTAKKYNRTAAISDTESATKIV